MATFNSRYTTSELLKVMERRSLQHYYWSYNNGEYTFYFIDNRRCPKLNSNGTYSIVSHKANYYRLRTKLTFLPFRLILDPRSKWNTYRNYLYDIVPDSCFIFGDAGFKIKELNERYGGQLVVRVVVI